MENKVCGIDFGTTNSTIGIVVGNSPLMIKVEGNKTSIPTTLFFEEKKSKPLFGQEAIDKYIGGEDGRFIRSVKRILGTDLMEKFTIINGKGRRFDELIYLFFAHLKSKAEETIQTEITSTVIGRPVHFQDNDTKADIAAENKIRKIAAKVGFQNIVFQYEPIAAAFSHEKDLTNEKLALVIDIGGGTSDFTIIRLGPQHATKVNRKDDILSTSGVRVGGNDFDKDLSIESFMPNFGKNTTYGEKHLSCPIHLFTDLSEWSKINFAYTSQTIHLIQKILSSSDEPPKIQRLFDLVEFQEAHRLLQVVEDTKVGLTEQKEIHTFFDAFKEMISFSITKQSFENAIKNDIEKIEKSMKECLNSANLEPAKIDLVILTGGSCEIPIIQRTFKGMFPQAAFSEKEKLLSVGFGLTEMARTIF